MIIKKKYTHIGITHLKHMNKTANLDLRKKKGGEKDTPQ